MRYLLLSIVTFITGYILGTLFGYRTAVVDYVENDAKTIRAMADTMYDKADDEDVPDVIQEAIDEVEDDESTTVSDDGPKGYQ